MKRWAPLTLILLLLLLSTLLPPGALADAVITVRKTVNRAEAQVGDVLRYTIYFNNTGNAIARKVWINDTLPQGTRYRGDNASAAGGVRAGNYNWTFTNLAVGTHFFYLNLTVTNQAVPGRYLVNLAALNYTNSVGVKQPPSTAGAATLFGMKFKTLHFAYNGVPPPNKHSDYMQTPPPTVNRDCTLPANQCDWDGDGFPGVTVANVPLNFSIPSTYYEFIQFPYLNWYFHLRGGGNLSLWLSTPGLSGVRTLNIYVIDWSGSGAYFLSAFSRNVTLTGSAGTLFEQRNISVPTIDNWTAPGHYLLLLMNAAGSSNPLRLAYDSTRYDSTWSMRTDTYVDVLGVDTGEVGGAGSQKLFTHGERIQVYAGVVDPLLTPAGQPDISSVWVNITDPSGALILSYGPLGFLRDSWPVRFFFYTFTPVPWPLQGTYNYQVFAREGNGIVVSRNGTFDIRYPVMTFAKVVDRATVTLGQTFNYTIYFNNSGTSVARILWANDTLPLASADYVSDNAATRNGTLVTPYHWRFLNVSAANHNFSITMRLRSDAQPPNPFVNRVYFNYTDTKYRWEPQVSVLRSANTLGPYVVLRGFMSNPAPRDGEIFALLTYFNNTGNEAAPVGWLNYTISPNLIYQGDSAAATGLPFTRTLVGNVLQLRFTGVTSGAHAMQVNLTYRAGLLGGANATTPVTLQYRAASGAQPPTQTALAVAYLHEPNIALSLGFSSATGNPGDRITITLGWSNLPAQASAARYLYLNATLPLELTFRSASSGGSYNAATRVITWTFPSVAAGTLGSVTTDVAVQVGVADARRLPVVAKATFRDDALGERPPKYVYGNLTTTAPVLTLGALVDRTTAEYQDTVTYRLYFNNTGTGRAAYAYLNGTLGTDLTLVTVSGPGAIVLHPAQGTFELHLVNATTGGYSALVTARVATAFGVGRVMGASFSLDVSDNNGNPGTRQTANPPAVLLNAPKLDVTIVADRSSASPGDRLRYTIAVRNNGTATAKGYWVNMSFGPYLNYLSDSSLVSLRRIGNDYSWHFADLAPGAQLTFTVDLEVNTSAPADRTISEVVVLDYTEGRGLVVNQTRSQGSVIRIAAPSGLLSGPVLYLLPLLAVAAAGGAVVALRRRSRVEIEEIFVVYKDGTLLAHRSKTLTPDKDEDVLTAMFTAVQEFISDSFELGENKEVKGLNIGDYTVEIQRGVFIYVALVFKGTATPRLRARLQAVVRDIEAEYHDTLSNWTGNMDLVKGLRDRVKVLLKGSR